MPGRLTMSIASQVNAWHDPITASAQSPAHARQQAPCESIVGSTARTAAALEGSAWKSVVSLKKVQSPSATARAQSHCGPHENSDDVSETLAQVSHA